MGLCNCNVAVLRSASAERTGSSSYVGLVPESDSVEVTECHRLSQFLENRNIRNHQNSSMEKIGIAGIACSAAGHDRQRWCRMEGIHPESLI